MATEIMLEKTMSAYREAIFLCCYTQQALHPCIMVHEMHDCMCIPSELELEVAIEAPEANLMVNEKCNRLCQEIVQMD